MTVHQRRILCIVNPTTCNPKGTNRCFKRERECQGEFRGCRTESVFKVDPPLIGLVQEPLFVSCTIVRVEPPSFNSERAALPLPEH